MRRIFKNQVIPATLLSILAIAGVQAVHNESTKAPAMHSVADGETSSTYPSDTGWG
ncbi:hypothetical protein [Streptomyces prunicolor]